MFFVCSLVGWLFSFFFDFMEEDHRNSSILCIYLNNIVFFLMLPSLNVHCISRKQNPRASFSFICALHTHFSYLFDKIVDKTFRNLYIPSIIFVMCTKQKWLNEKWAKMEMGWWKIGTMLVTHTHTRFRTTIRSGIYDTQTVQYRR